MASSGKRTYYPPKTFDDDLDGLVTLYDKKGWSFWGVDLDQLKVDRDVQRKGRTEHDALEGQYLAVHEKFGLDQEARYRRFASALNAPPGARPARTRSSWQSSTGSSARSVAPRAIRRAAVESRSLRAGQCPDAHCLMTRCSRQVSPMRVNRIFSIEKQEVFLQSARTCFPMGYEIPGHIRAFVRAPIRTQ